MPPQLCCVAEEDDRSSSPDLPNARLSVTVDGSPAKRPLLHSRTGSHASRFTSVQTDDLHELRQIFNNAEDSGPSPKRASRARFVRPSVYSLHSLHKIKSVQALLGRRRSRDLAKTSSSDLHSKGSRARQLAAAEGAETVLRTPKHGAHLDLQVTKADLRRDLLSDKGPEEGGYDSDADVLDDIAKKVAKKTPSKRPSLHSIDWTPTPEHVRTPDSTKNRRTPAAGHGKGRTPHKHTSMKSMTPGTTRFSNVFSSPNLPILTPKSRARRLKRSHSATSAEIPAASPLISIRLPSIIADDGVPWAQSMHESLRLSQWSTPPSLSEPKPSRRFSALKTKTIERTGPKEIDRIVDFSRVVESQHYGRRSISEPLKPVVLLNAEAPHTSFSSEKEERVQPAASQKPLQKPPVCVSEDDDPRSSVHLHNMRISYHLRSASLMSGKNKDVSELPPPPPIFRDRTVSEYSRSSRLANRSRHGRQTSSSGFASTKIPSKWGNVVAASSQQREEMSSIYSSRPHSPPDSLGGSMGNLSLPARQGDSTVDLPRSYSNNYLTDNEKAPKPAKPAVIASSTMVVDLLRSRPNHQVEDEDETPRPTRRFGFANSGKPADKLIKESLSKGPAGSAIARHNSVANTKTSKFREEFSPTPPRKRSTPTISFMKMLRYRGQMRSQSEANLRSLKLNLDGPADDIPPSTRRERAMSQSLISMQKEQESMGKEKEANPVWQKALKSYQDEKSSLLLPGNRGVTGQTSPFRERSSSISVRARSTRSVTPVPSIQEVETLAFTTQPHTPLEGPVVEEDEAGPAFLPKLRKRRTAMVHADDVVLDPTHELRAAFDKQTDTIETVGAWGRYPSHTRHDRTGSAGHADNVQTRDFALEAAIRFAKGADPDESVDPTARPESPVSASGKKRKKKVGSGRMVKSTSMTFGKTFLKNYTKRFRSQSTEFHRHGYGHRSSIAAGGLLKHPELEMLPQVFSAPIVEDRARERSKQEASDSSQEDNVPPPSELEPAPAGKGKQEADKYMSTLRTPKANERHAGLDGVADTDTSTDRARVWSIYYEDCMPTYPRASKDFASTSQPELAEFDKVVERQEFGAMPQTDGCHSVQSKRTSIKSIKSHTVPSRHRGRHSRHVSRMSRVSVTSRASFAPSFVSLGQSGGDGADESSLVSVRKSTLDLLNVYREQEITERERVLNLMRAESVRCA